MNTRFIAFNSLDIEKQNKLFNLLVEYASTPLEEREEEKKYYIRHKYLENKTNCLNYDTCEKGWFISSKPHTSRCKTQFTLTELPGWAKEMLEQGHFVKEEVE